MAKRYRLIVYNHGKRLEKVVLKDQLNELRGVARDIRERGGQCVIVPCNINNRWEYLYPDPDDVDEMRKLGKLWCPYCREWRWFKIPKAYKDPEILTREWFLNVYRNNETMICAWCEIPIKDFYVCTANGIYGEVWSGPRRRRRKPGVRSRIRRRVI